MTSMPGKSANKHLALEEWKAKIVVATENIDIMARVHIRRFNVMNAFNGHFRYMAPPPITVRLIVGCHSGVTNTYVYNPEIRAWRVPPHTPCAEEAKKFIREYYTDDEDREIGQMK